MTIRYHPDLIQGSDEWLAARCGMLTASEMKLILTPTLKPAKNDKERAHLYELLAQRITRYVEPHYVSDDMLRGQDDEATALDIYAEHYAPIHDMGFITNDKWGFQIGYSPDALVGDVGLVEVKSRRQKFQIETFLIHVTDGTIPPEYMLQIQTGLMVSERKWCDLVSYSAGLPMAVIRVHSDTAIHAMIVAAATEFERRLSDAHTAYLAAVAQSNAIPTERVAREIIV